MKLTTNEKQYLSLTLSTFFSLLIWLVIIVNIDTNMLKMTLLYVLFGILGTWLVCDLIFNTVRRIGDKDAKEIK